MLAQDRTMIDKLRHDQDTLLKWATNHEHWTEAERKTVVWSDECSVKRSKGVRQVWVYQVPANKWKPFAIQPKRNGSRVSVMVWAAFDGYKRSQLQFCERDPEAARGGVTARTYFRLLRRQLPILCDTEGPTATSIFMHDNAPIHSADCVQE